MKARLNTGLTCNEPLLGAQGRGSLLALSVRLFTVRVCVCFCVWGSNSFERCKPWNHALIYAWVARSFNSHLFDSERLAINYWLEKFKRTHAHTKPHALCVHYISPTTRAKAAYTRSWESIVSHGSHTQTHAAGWKMLFWEKIGITSWYNINLLHESVGY